jgi:hypothetical protein
MLAVGGVRLLGEGLKNLVENEDFYLGLRLLLFGPAIEWCDDRQYTGQ